MKAFDRARDWLDARTGYRALVRHALDEPLPPGTGWAFTSGSILTLLLAVQFLTGVVLAMYYVPSPALAYDSVRFVMDALPLGWLVRGLHVWGASFLVVAAGIHLLRVFLFGSFKAPREVTWLTGVLLLLLILAFSLSGYLLPWDQKAYWATTVTLNIAASTPLVGDLLAAVLRGGAELGALTLGRWYAAHVLLLPAAIVVFVVAHILLLRRHGVSGPITPVDGPVVRFFPWHVVKDTVMMAAVFALLLTFALLWPAHLDEIADPADATYVPRPEWYFLALFELLKYFPGPLEPIGTLLVPGLIVGFLLAVPFLDRGGERRPWHRRRLPVAAAMAAVVGGVAHMTVLGLLDTPARYDPDAWGPRSIAGLALLQQPDLGCRGCHVAGGPASDLSLTRVTRDEEWLLHHMADPVALAPGVRTEADPAPRPLLSRLQAQAVVAYLRRVRAGAAPPEVSDEDRLAATAFATSCVGCHRVAGEGGQIGPDLTTVGRRRTLDALARIIRDPTTEYGDTMMPAFGERLTPQQVEALASYLARLR
ncbi:MAG: cytochrome b N-terminal domain-containing protein [Acidobacteriota bacterium]